jgi:hypothetical protein
VAIKKLHHAAGHDQKLSKGVPRELKDVFGSPPLISGEDAEAYNGLLAAVAASVLPKDAIQWMFVRDIVDISWQILRERRIEVAVIETARKEVILDLLKSTHGSSGQAESALYRVFSTDDEAQGWLADPKARKEVESKLAARGYQRDEILGKAYVRAAPQIGLIQSRLQSYERRRASILRDIEKYNEALARSLANAPLDVIDAEFSEAAE